MKNSLCLGYTALNDWECLLLREGYIEKYHADFLYSDVSDDLERIKNYRVKNKGFLFFSMVLFDKIDSSYLSMYDLKKIIDLGIINEHAAITESDLHLMPETEFKELNQKIYIENEIMRSINETSIEIMILNKNNIMRSIQNYHDRHGYKIVNSEELSNHYLEWIKDCEFWGDQAEWGPTREALGIFKESIMQGLYNSVIKGDVYYEGIPSITSNNISLDINEKNLVSEISYILQLDLTPLINYMPIPNSMDEVIKLRKRPEIKQFREIFFTWCDYIRNNELYLASKIKEDIERANRELEKYYYWERKKTQWFNCLFDIIGGQVPYLSNVLSGISPLVLQSMLNRRINNSWVLLLK